MTKKYQNGFSVDYMEHDHTARLYSPNETFLVSSKCTDQSFNDVANSLLTAYFIGWCQCKGKLIKQAQKTLNVDVGVIAE